MSFHVGGDYACYFGLDGGINDIAVGGWSMGAANYRVWHAGNDGAGSGLDADLLDGAQPSVSASNNTIVKRHSSGYIFANYFNTTANDVSSGVTKVMVETGNDNYIRHGTADAIRAFINVESGATGDQTASEILTAIKTVDGSGSGLDADLLDGKHHTNFGATLATYGTTAGASGRIRCTAPFNTNSAHMFQVTVSIYSSYTIHTYVVGGYMYPSTNQWLLPKCIYTGTGSPDIYVGRDANGKAYISIANGNYTGVRVHNMTLGYQTNATDIYDPWTITIDGGNENSVSVTTSKVWHSTNDGSGSGLDADLLDGINSGSFLRSDTDDTFSGGSLSFGSSVRQMINLYATYYALGVQSGTLYYRSGGRFSWFKGGSHNSAENNPGTGGSVAMTLDGSSNLTVSGNVTAYSDIKLKKNIEVISNALDKVMQLRGVTYDRVDMDSPRQTGLIAQEVEKVLPEVVGTDEEYKSVAYGNMVGLLIEAIKEQQEQIDILKEEIEELKK